MHLVQAIRSLLFYIALALMTIIWSSIGFTVALFLPFHLRYRVVNQAWAVQAVWLAKVIAGVGYEVQGLENLPKQPCVILARHESTWETFYFSALFSPLSQVVKRELLKIPFWGWSMAILKPIAIDRGNHRFGRAIDERDEFGQESGPARSLGVATVRVRTDREEAPLAGQDNRPDRRMLQRLDEGRLQSIACRCGEAVGRRIEDPHDGRAAPHLQQRAHAKA